MSNLTFTDAPALMGMIALSMILVRIIERLLDIVIKRRTNGKHSLIPQPVDHNSLTPEEHAALMRLDELHSKTDGDGIPLWYVPRSMLESLKEMTEIQDRISVRLRDLVTAQKNLNNKIDRWEDRTR